MKKQIDKTRFGPWALVTGASSGIGAHCGEPGFGPGSNGVVKTHMLTTGIFKLISYLARPFAVSPQQGAATSVYLASSPGLGNVTGKYFAYCKSAVVKAKFNTEENRHLLWNTSMDCLQQSKRSRSD